MLFGFDEDDIVDAGVIGIAVEIFQLLPGGSDVQYFRKCNQSSSFAFSKENLIMFRWEIIFFYK